MDASNKQAVFLETGAFSHFGPNNNTPGDRAKDAGLTWTSVGENIASPDTPEGAFQRLMDSPKHRDNIVNPGFDQMGVGGTGNGQGQVHEGVWVQM